jgi:hypothetical protein
MRVLQLGTLVVASLGLVGCAQTVTLAGGKGLRTISRTEEAKFLERLGYPDNHSGLVSRSRTGDRLFIQFDDHVKRYDAAVRYKVAIIGSSSIVVEDLPGESYLNDEGEPVVWTRWLNNGRTPWQFANGSVLATNIYCRGHSDGRFIPLFRAHQDHWWIARVESPLEEIVTFDWGQELELLISHQERLHVFVRGKPEGKPRRDRWFILKHYEYQVNRDTARLLQVQDFYDTWAVMDFDPETNLMFASSWSTKCAHGLLVNTVDGKRKDVRVGCGRGYFLTDAVVKRFNAALGDR